MKKKQFNEKNEQILNKKKLLFKHPIILIMIIFTLIACSLYIFDKNYYIMSKILFFTNGSIYNKYLSNIIFIVIGLITIILGIIYFLFTAQKETNIRKGEKYCNLIILILISMILFFYLFKYSMDFKCIINDDYQITYADKDKNIYGYKSGKGGNTTNSYKIKLDNGVQLNLTPDEYKLLNQMNENRIKVSYLKWSRIILKIEEVIIQTDKESYEEG